MSAEGGSPGGDEYWIIRLVDQLAAVLESHQSSDIKVNRATHITKQIRDMINTKGLPSMSPIALSKVSEEGTFSDSPNVSQELLLPFTKPDPSDISDMDLFPKVKNPTYSIDWNAKFQKYLGQVDSTKKFKKIASLARDFLYIAETYGRIIISEQFITEGRTIQSVDFGGTAGGKKYQCQNILFKFATDSLLSNQQWLYGGNEMNTEKAMKGACNELKGLTAFFHTRINEFHYPLMTLIQHRGYCLLAESILPINESTLIYGSCDSGTTIKGSPEIAKIMAKVADLLHLEEHKVGDYYIVGPGDIEVHRGKDNKYYVVDFGRLMPPEFPNEYIKRPGNPVFYDLLRPLFVQQWGMRLCSDALTGWIKYDPNQDQLNENIEVATRYLHDELIPKFAEYLGKKSDFSQEELIIELHRAGINCRHLGRITSILIKSCKLGAASRVLTECVARNMKNELRAVLRSKMEYLKIATEDPYKEEVFKFFLSKIYVPPKKPQTFEPQLNTPQLVIEGNRVSLKSVEGYSVLVAKPFIPPGVTTYYFEIKLLSGSEAGIALSPELPPNAIYSFDNSNVTQYLSSGKILFNSSNQITTTPWNKGEIFGLFYNSTKRMVVATRNGRSIGSHFINDHVTSYVPLLFVGESSVVEYNLGNQFKFPLKSFCNGLYLPNPEIPDLPEVKDYWRNHNRIKKELMMRFPKCLPRDYLSDDLDLRSFVDMQILVDRLQVMCGVRFSERLLKIKAGDYFYVMESDIEQLHSRISHMGIIDYALAVYTLLSLESEVKDPGNEKETLLLAEKQLASVLNQTNIINPRDYYYWGSIWLEISKRTEGPEKINCIKKAKKHFKCLSSLTIDPNHDDVKTFPGERKALLANLRYKQADIFLLLPGKTEKAKLKFHEAFSERPQLATRKLSVLNRQMKNSTDKVRAKEIFEEAKVVWEACLNHTSPDNKEAVTLTNQYIGILCTSVDRNMEEEEWPKDCTPIMGFKELWELFSSPDSHFVISCVHVYLSEGSIDGMHLAIILKLFELNGLVSKPELQKMMRSLITLPVTHNTTRLFQKTVESFYRLCKCKVLKEILEESKIHFAIVPSEIIYHQNQPRNLPPHIKRGMYNQQTVTVLNLQHVLYKLAERERPICVNKLKILLRSIQSDGILPLIGVCYEHENEMLVFKGYPRKGSLSKCIALDRLFSEKKTIQFEDIKNFCLLRIQYAKQLAFLCNDLHSNNPPIVAINFSVDHIMIGNDNGIKLVDFSESSIEGEVNTIKEKIPEKSKDIENYAKLLQFLLPEQFRLTSPQITSSIKNWLSTPKKISFSQIIESNIFEEASQFVSNYQINEFPSDISSTLKLENWLSLGLSFLQRIQLETYKDPALRNPGPVLELILLGGTKKYNVFQNIQKKKLDGQDFDDQLIYYTTGHIKPTELRKSIKIRLIRKKSKTPKKIDFTFCYNIWNLTGRNSHYAPLLVTSESIVFMQFLISDPQAKTKIEFWCEMLCNKEKAKFKVVLIGITDKDEDTQFQEFSSFLTNAYKNQIEFIFEKPIYTNVLELSDLQEIATTHYADRKTKKLYKNSYHLEEALKELKKEKSYTTLDEVIKIGNLIRISTEETKNTLLSLHNNSKIYFSENLPDFIVLDRFWLLKAFMQIPSQDNGIISKSFLFNLWLKSYNEQDLPKLVAVGEENGLFFWIEHNLFIPSSHPKFDEKEFNTKISTEFQINRNFLLNRVIGPNIIGKIIQEIYWMFNMKVVECNQNICVVEVSDLSLISTGHVKIENSIWKKAHDKPTLSIEVLADNQELYYDLFAFVLEVFTKISKNAKLHIQSFWKCNSNSFNLPSNYEISVTETEEKFLRGNADNEKGIGLIIPEIVIPEFNGNKYPFEALKIREKDKQREYSTATLEVGKAEPKHVLVKEFQPGQRLEFRKEIVNHSEHPNIETIHGIVYFPPCIILEDFPLGDLNTLLQKREIYLSWEWKIQVLLDIARALEHLHGSVIPVAHRLVRTENIMITSLDPTHPCAKLANFRNSLKVRYFIKEIPPKVHFTETRWLAPEILSGEPYDTKVDIYAFGYICWDLITRETSYDMDANIPQLIQEEKYHKMKNKILHNEIISLLNAAWTKSPWDSIIKALEILKSKEKIESFEKENKKNYDNYLRQPFIKVQYAGIAKLFHKPTNEYYCTIKYDNVVLYTPALHSHIPHWNQSYTINTKNQAEEVEFQIFMRDREGLGSLQFIGKSNTTIEFSRTQDVNLQVINNRSVVGELHIQIHPPSK